MKARELVTREILENIFVTAIEGGSNYWYFIDDENHEKIRRAVPIEKDKCFSTALFRAVYDEAFDIDVHDIEDTEEKVGTLSIRTMFDRLETLMKDEGYKWAIFAELDENGDADSSDVVFQYLTMGEVVYA
jgi:hypothetical protein